MVYSQLNTLCSQIETYSPDSKYDEFLWVCDPCNHDIENNKLTLEEREQLIELSNDTGLKVNFQEKCINNV